MKKMILLMVVLLLGGYLAAQNFVADISLVSEMTVEQKSAFYKKTPPPFLVVYQKNGRTLVLLGAKHGVESLPAVQYAFDTYHPQVALIEREPGFPLEARDCHNMEDAYTAVLSAKNNIPLVRTDADLERQWKYAQQNGFSYEDFQMFWIIRSAYGLAKEDGIQPTAAQEIKDYERTVHNPAWGPLFTEEGLLIYFQEHYNRDFNTTDFISFYLDLMEVSPKKWVRKTPFYRLAHLNPDVRSVFMLQNIAAALNEYEVVFSEMGAGHFMDIHKALKKMMGKPRYIPAEQIPQQELLIDCRLDNLQEKILVR